VRGGFAQWWRHRDKSFWVWLLAVAVLLVLVINPLLRLVLASFQQPNGTFTLAYYAAAYGRVRHLDALINSLVLGASAATLCLAFGLPLAWALSRTDMPGKGLVWVSILGTFIIPPYLGAVGWMLLAGPNAGWLNRAFVALAGTDAGPFNIYSMPGLVLVTACYSFPYVFVFAKSALDLLSSEMEDAANILGAGTLRTTLSITLPLVLPAIVAAFILVFLEAIALFGTPALLALPGRFHVVTTQLWQFFEHPPRVGVAAAFAMPLLCITVLLFWVQHRITRRKGYVALTGKGGERRPVRLGRWKWPLLGYCLAVCMLSFFLPMVVICQAAFAKAWGRGFSLDNLTLRNLHFTLFENSLTRNATLHTFLYGGAAAVIALALAAVPRLRRAPAAGQPAAGRRTVVRHHGAFRHPRDRAGDRFLRRVHAAAARAVRHGLDPDPRLRHALPPDRLRQQRRGHPQHQPGARGCGAHPRRDALRRDPPCCRAAAQA
jgi:iron(III) transport system permease protein